MQRDDFAVKEFPSLAGLTGDAPGKLRVLIATEEIVGPVRNGGIASTYYHLARGLAAEGHEVTVLYLKGHQVENATSGHWISEYRKFGIDFVPLPELGEPLAGASAIWQRRWMAFYRWLKARPSFDIVHSSEWRGGAFYCLQAKRLGLAFRNTLFVVKTSSPYIWNRHYQMQEIDNADLLVASFAEQKCVEWADMVVGGSAHLLSFMDRIGYRLPEGRTYVQPNIVDFSEVKVEDRRPARDFGETVKTRELVFFGRLEARKGLDLFVLALDALAAKGIEIARVTFLGKEGEPLTGQGGARPLDFIRDHAAAWPFPADIVTDLDQPEALSLMCSRDMIAAMPSLIENSTMAVYEALVHKIPFVATAVGGTPELIDAADHETHLVPPEAAALAERLERALDDGQPLARPAFDNAANLATWYGFHRYLAENGIDGLVPRAPASADMGVAYIAWCADPAALIDTARNALAMPGVDDIQIYVPFRLTGESARAASGWRDDRIAVLEAPGAGPGDCFNRARKGARGDILLFDAAGATRFEGLLASSLRAALAARPDDLVTAAFHFDADARGQADTLFAPLGGDPAAEALTGAAYGLEIVAGRKETFDAIGDFLPYRVAKGVVHELVTRAAMQGRELFVVPEPLMRHARDFAAIAERRGEAGYLEIMPLIEEAPLPVRKLLLHRPDAARAPGNAGRVILGQAHREAGETVWLGNMAKLGRLDELPNRHHVLLGFDRAAGRLDFAALHEGQLSILANGREIRRDPAFGARGALTADSLDLLPLIDDSNRLRLRIELAGPGKTRFASILAQRIEDGICFLSARAPIFWDGDFAAALALLGGERAEPPLPPLRRLPERKPSLNQRIRAHMAGRR